MHPWSMLYCVLHLHTTLQPACSHWLLTWLTLHDEIWTAVIHYLPKAIEGLCILILPLWYVECTDEEQDFNKLWPASIG